MSNNINMADFIIERRKTCGMTQKQLAEKLNITDKAVSKWERGQGYPDITILQPLAAALGVSVAELLNGQYMEPPTKSANMLSGNAPQEDAMNGASALNEETAVSKTLQYANKVVDDKNSRVKSIFKFVITTVFLLGIVTCAIVDIALNKKITWAIIPIAGIILEWSVIMPLLHFERKRCLLSLTALSILVFPLLKIIEGFTGGGWFYPVAVGCAALGLLYLWVIYFLLLHTKFNSFTKLAIIFSFAALLNCGISLLIGNDASIWPSMGTISFAIVFFGIGRLQKSKHQAE